MSSPLTDAQVFSASGAFDLTDWEEQLPYFSIRFLCFDSVLEEGVMNQNEEMKIMIGEERT